MKGSHRIRLALTYLGIITALSISFSFLVYSVSVGELNYDINRQINTIQTGTSGLFGDETIDNIRAEALNRFKHDITRRLELLNIAMLALGSIVGYYLAKKNLEPLEESIEMQARFSSDTAHELRTPLTAMKTELEVGLRQSDLKVQEAKALLASNLEEVTKLNSLITSLLRLSQEGYDGNKSQWQKTNLNQLVTAAIKKVRDLADARHMSFKIYGLGDHQILGDQDQLIELFTILIDNAIKYGEDGMSIIIRAREIDKHIQISIKDQGVGIKDTDVPHIFERFYRADQSRSKNAKSGYGLGLSLAKAIALRHQAKINVKSKLGVGTTFTIDFPKKLH